MGTPEITVLMPVYNGERYLVKAIQSIIEQTFDDFELLIINDGSTDRTPEIIEQFSDLRIRVVNNEKNIGLIETLNKGIGLANGRYIARMDSDDLSVADRLAKQWSFMETYQDVGVCGSWVKTFSESRGELWAYPTTNAEIRCRMLFSSMLAHPSVIIRKAMLAENHLEYSSSYIYAEDYELWSRCMDRCNLANLPEPLLNYRLHESSTGMLHADAQKKTVMSIQRNILKRLGVEASGEELDLHYQVGRLGGLNVNLGVLDSVDAWLSRLAEANRICRYFPEPEFRRTLALYWLSVCTFMLPLGPVVARRFSGSMHAEGLSSPFRERVKLELTTRRNWLARLIGKA